METTNTGGSVAHDGVAEIVCKDGKTLVPSYDTAGTNNISLTCSGGEFAMPQAWPAADHCKAVCDATAAGVPVPAGMTKDAAATDVWEGETLKATCDTAGTFTNTDWSRNEIDLVCGADGQFVAPDPTPECLARPKCGTPPVPAAALGLTPVTAGLVEVEVTKSASYKCSVDGYVTTVGATINIPCLQPDPATPQDYVLPTKWGGVDTQCREAVKCTNPPDAPAATGLTREDAPADGYPEFSSAKYTCTNTAHVFWRNGDKLTGVTEFEVGCQAGGAFDPSPDWVTCDDPNPPRCTNFPTLAAGFPLVRNPSDTETDKLPGKAAEYKCPAADMTSNLGDIVLVSGQLLHFKDDFC